MDFVTNQKARNASLSQRLGAAAAFAGVVFSMQAVCLPPVQAQTPQPYSISTFAGAPLLQTPAPAMGGAWDKPVALAFNSKGVLYFAAANSVYMLQSGQVNRVAGTGRTGFSGDGGPAVAAQLNSPNFLLFDAKGNLYISDAGNSRIRVLNTSGIINTICGNGIASDAGDGGPATSASLNRARAMAFDSAGNLYIADFAGNVVRKISATDGTISTFAGNGTQGYLGDGAAATAAELALPLGLAVDSKGNVYISDYANQVIREVTTDGNINTIAGSQSAGVGYAGDGGAATLAQLSLPEALALDSKSNLYIADYANGVIRIITADGNINTFAGTGGTPGYTGDGGPATAAELNGVYSMVFDAAGNLYIADYNNYAIRVINTSSVINTIAQGNPAPTLGGDGGPATLATMGAPLAVAMDPSGNVYIADHDNFRVRKVTPDGKITTFAGTGTPGYSGDGGPATKATMTSPTGLAVDPLGNVYISDVANQVVRMVSPSGIMTTVAGNKSLGAGWSGDLGPATSAQLTSPGPLAADNQGNVYIADVGNFVIRQLAASSGYISTIAGNNTQGFMGDGGAATGAEFQVINGLALDSNNNLYIADSLSHRIRKMSLITGIINTVVGTGMGDFAGDNLTPLNTDIQAPAGMAVDASGNIYFADSQNYRIRIAPQTTTGVVTTIAGNGSSGYTGDGGLATQAQMSPPLGMVMDATGRIYFADSGNNAIRLVQPELSHGNALAVVNAASNLGGSIAPGELVTLYGVGIGPSQIIQATATQGTVPSTLANTRVTFNGVAAPLIYTWNQQVAAVVPYELATSTNATLVLQYNGLSTVPFNVPVTFAAPAIFTAGNGAGQAAALNQDGSANTSVNPAKAGSVITLYATGAGQTNPAGVTGKLNTAPYASPVLPVSVTIAGKTATLQYSGDAPGLVSGMMQINAVIPAGVSGAAPVVLTVGGVASTSPVTISVN